jgi:hypothetical protein
MVKIPGGRFLMGSPDTEAGRRDKEGPQHYVDVPEFFMGKYQDLRSTAVYGAKNYHFQDIATIHRAVP